MIPEYVDLDGVAIFTTNQIDDFGLPEDNGWLERYWVVESKVLQMSFSQEQTLKQDLCARKPPHVYCRTSRFRTCLFQILGKTGFVGKTKRVIEDMILDIPPFERMYLTPCLVWEYLREMLKQRNLSTCYNRIPAIGQMAGMLKKVKITQRQIVNILSDFDTMHEIFPKIKYKLERKYFPSLRFTCLMLLKRYHVHMDLEIPITRTKSKTQSLVNDFHLMWDYINEEISSSIFS